MMGVWGPQAPAEFPFRAVWAALLPNPREKNSVFEGASPLQSTPE